MEEERTERLGNCHEIKRQTDSREGRRQRKTLTGICRQAGRERLASGNRETGRERDMQKDMKEM